MMRAGFFWFHIFRGLYCAAVHLAVDEKLDLSGWGPGGGQLGETLAMEKLCNGRGGQLPV